jgi:hypothetical protein
MRRLAAFLLIVACGPEPAPGSTGEVDTTGAVTTGPVTTTGATASTETGTGSGETGSTAETTGNGEESTGGPGVACACVDRLDHQCQTDFPGCDPPLMCDLLNLDEPSAETADCVGALLRDRPLARFSYCWNCNDWETHDGEFLIRGPELDAVDFECTTIDFSQDLLIRFHGLEPPAYFAGCLAMVNAKAKTDCLISGLHVGETVPQCGG